MKHALYCIIAIGNFFENTKKPKKLFDKQTHHTVWNTEWWYGWLGDTLYIIHRGTNDILDIVRDIDARQQVTPYPSINPQIKVHSGFMDMYKLSRNSVLKEAEKAKKIILTGHSLGSPLSIFAALDLQFHFPEKDITCITFGGPREGNLWFQKSYNNRVPKTYKFIHGADMVCKLPPIWMGYRHVGKVIKIGHNYNPWENFFGSWQDHGYKKYLSAINEKYKDLDYNND